MVTPARRDSALTLAGILTLLLIAAASALTALLGIWRLPSGVPLTVVPQGSLGGVGGSSSVSGESMLVPSENSTATGAQGVEVVRWDWSTPSGTLFVDAAVQPAPGPAATCTLHVNFGSSTATQVGELLMSIDGVAHCVVEIRDDRLTEPGAVFTLAVEDSGVRSDSEPILLKP